jgi:hypothetical protein
VIANVTVSERDEFDDLLERVSLKKTLRVCALMKRFLDKCCGIPVAGGPLTSVELELQMEWWIRREVQTVPQEKRKLLVNAMSRGVA